MVHLHMKTYHNCVKPEVLSLVTMKIIRLLNVTPWSVVDIYQLFRDTCYLNLQDRRLLRRFGRMCCPRLDVPRRWEVSVSSKTVVLFFFYQTWGSRIPENSNLHVHCIQNLNSRVFYLRELNWFAFTLSTKGCLTWRHEMFPEACRPAVWFELWVNYPNTL
jgi:hypothetical protein